MAKAIDLRIKGVKFEDALKKILAAQPLPKKGKSSCQKPVQKPHLN